LIEQGLTSNQTHYRSYWGRFLQVIWPNQQCQSTEGSTYWNSDRTAACWSTVWDRQTVDQPSDHDQPIFPTLECGKEQCYVVRRTENKQFTSEESFIVYKTACKLISRCFFLRLTLNPKLLSLFTSKFSVFKYSQPRKCSLGGDVERVMSGSLQSHPI